MFLTVGLIRFLVVRQSSYWSQTRLHRLELHWFESTSYGFVVRAFYSGNFHFEIAFRYFAGIETALKQVVQQIRPMECDCVSH